MAKTVLITGCSSGIGKAAALYFARNRWNVAATMRNPEKEKEFSNFSNVKLYKLDVTDLKSIEKAIKSAISDFGKIDVVVNNAGYGAVGIFEKASLEQIKKEYDVNVFGVMAIIKEILPHFKKNKKGVIVNVSSVAGLMAYPAYSAYISSKWALEGFSESLQYELKPLNIKVKVVEPGPVKTDFHSRSIDLFKDSKVKGYEQIENNLIKKLKTQKRDSPLATAKAIFYAANDSSSRMRYTLTIKEKIVVAVKKFAPDRIFFRIAGRSVKKR